MNKAFILLLLQVVLNLRYYAQDPFYCKIRVPDECEGNEFYDVYQDSKGYMWFASDKGVLKYDGYRFRHYTSVDGLADNTIFTVYEDDQERLWLTGMNGNLSYIKRDKAYLYEYNDELQKAIKGTKIAKSVWVGKQEVKVGYLGGGLVSVRNGIAHNEIPAADDHFYVKEIEGRLLCFSPLGKHTRLISDSVVLIFENKTNKKRIILPYLGGANNLAVVKRRNGDVFIGIKGYLLEIRPDGDFQAYPVAHQIIRLYEDADSTLWISLKGNGLRMVLKNEPVDLDKATALFKDETFAGIFTDREQGMWLTSLYNGIYYIPNRHIFRFQPVAGPIVATTLLRTGPDAVIAGFVGTKLYEVSPGGIGRIFKDTSAHNHHRDINTLYYDPENKRLLIGETGKLVIFEKGRVSEKQAAANILSIARLKKDTYLGSHRSGISVHSPGAPVINHRFKIRSRVSKVFVKDSVIYAGSIDGLFRIDRHNRHEAVGGNLFRNIRITDIDTLANGNLIVATKGKGLFFMQAGKWIALNTSNGLHNDFINSIHIDDKGNVWAAGGYTLDKISIMPGKIDVTAVINQQSLMSAGQINDIDVYRGLVTMATTRGLIRFLEQDLKKNRLPPPIYIRSVTVNDSLYNTGAAGIPEWTYDKNFIRIDFTGLSFRNPGKIQYKYRLSGLNDGFHTTSSTYVQFTSLNPGRYRFEVYAANNDGTWSAKPAVFEFILLPPFWMTLWFKAAVVIFIALLLFGIIRFRTRRLRETSRAQEQILIYRQQALSAQINPHFISNTLNSIQSFIMTDDPRSANRYLSGFAALMRRVFTHSKKEFVPLSDELELIRLYVALEQLRFNDRFSFRCETDPLIEADEVLVPSMLIQPFIENAILHGINHSTGDNLYLLVSFKLQGPVLICTIEDNGIGFERSMKSKTGKDETHESSGINIIRERVRLCCKSAGLPFYFHIGDAGEQGGTRVLFHIPYIPCKP